MRVRIKGDRGFITVKGAGSPSWLGEEVTGDARYYNSMLSRHPYRKWVQTGLDIGK